MLASRAFTPGNVAASNSEMLSSRRAFGAVRPVLAIPNDDDEPRIQDAVTVAPAASFVVKPIRPLRYSSGSSMTYASTEWWRPSTERNCWVSGFSAVYPLGRARRSARGRMRRGLNESHPTRGVHCAPRLAAWRQ